MHDVDIEQEMRRNKSSGRTAYEEDDDDDMGGHAAAARAAVRRRRTERIEEDTFSSRKVDGRGDDSTVRSSKCRNGIHQPAQPTRPWTRRRTAASRSPRDANRQTHAQHDDAPRRRARPETGHGSVPASANPFRRHVAFITSKLLAFSLVNMIFDPLALPSSTTPCASRPTPSIPGASRTAHLRQAEFLRHLSHGGVLPRALVSGPHRLWCSVCWRGWSATPPRR